MVWAAAQRIGYNILFAFQVLDGQIISKFCQHIYPSGLPAVQVLLSLQELEWCVI